MCLYKMTCKKCCVIKKLPQMSLMNSLGLREGLSVAVKSIQPFGGPIVIKVGNRCIAIAKDLAEQIEVTEQIEAKEVVN